MLEVAKDFPEYTFAIADEEDYGEELKSLGLSESGEEVNVAILADGGKKYAMEPEELDADVLRDFVQAFKKGEAVETVYHLCPWWLSSSCPNGKEEVRLRDTWSVQLGLKSAVLQVNSSPSSSPSQSPRTTKARLKWWWERPLTRSSWILTKMS